MDKSKDIQKLAEVAIESENFELAYNYYCKLLENDIENSNYWRGYFIFKGKY